MSSLQFTTGRLNCSTVRNFLDQQKFKGMNINYLESSGWIQRDFTVTGHDVDLECIMESLVEWDNLTKHTK